MRFFFLILLLVVSSCVPLPSTSSSETNTYSDKAYDDLVKSIRIVRPAMSSWDAYPPAAVPLDGQDMILEFDYLSPSIDNLNAKIIHCTADWQQSSLSNLDFISQYNEFPLLDYEVSANTAIPYVHYTFPLPKVNLPGNYIVQIMRGDETLLTRRFMIFNNTIQLQEKGNLVGSGNLAQRSQQLNFTLSYPEMEIINPLDRVSVYIRQNQRWDNIEKHIKPTFVNEPQHTLDYQFFNSGGGFLKGGNEFRFADIRSAIYTGQNVNRIDRTTKPITVYMDVDKPRTSPAYSQQPDYDGTFGLANLDNPNLLASEYMNVNFELKSPSVDGNVYVNGGFNGWEMDARNRMHYDSAAQAYKATLLLRQGWYDYLYSVDGKGTSPLEGDHFETENFYEIMVYYRSLQPYADLLIGYFTTVENPR